MDRVLVCRPEVSRNTIAYNTYAIVPVESALPVGRVPNESPERTPKVDIGSCNMAASLRRVASHRATPSHAR